MNVAIIPARGGSKRVPRKNVRSFCGKPMIAWPIEAAIRSALFDRVVVTTDDAEVEECALEYGAEVPFRRPSELADDQTPLRPVIIHAINELELGSQPIDYVCCISATAPLITGNRLASSLQILQESRKDFAFTVLRFPHPIQRALRVSSEGDLSMVYPEHRKTRSQDLEETYHDAGQFYWGKANAFKLDKPTFSSRSIPILIPSYMAVDIDTEEDFLHAEILFKGLNCIKSLS